MNREAFKEFLPPDNQKKTYGGKQVIVCFLDMDYLKHIYDNHVHLAGDEALRLLAAMVKAKSVPRTCFSVMEATNPSSFSPALEKRKPP